MNGRRALGIVALVGFVAATLAGCGKSTPTPVASSLPVRTVEAGAVDVTVTPTLLDSSGATFAIVLDTHSVELSLDMAAAAVLNVGGTVWPTSGWSGDGPSGHHRTGELRFTAAGPAAGTAILTISGLSKPVEATWELGDG